jgi:RHS repeat-associated protein
LIYDGGICIYDDLHRFASTTRFSPSRFTGKERDAESGNDYFGARYYASSTGRFTSPDWAADSEPIPYATLDNPQSFSLYGYLRNNPLGGTDADGHDQTEEGFGTAITCNDAMLSCDYPSPFAGEDGLSQSMKAMLERSGAQTGSVQVNSPNGLGCDPSRSLMCARFYHLLLANLHGNWLAARHNAPNSGTNSPSCGKVWGKAIAGTLLDATGLIPGEGTIASGIKIAGTVGGIALSASGSLKDATAGGVFTGVGMYADATKQEFRTLGKDVAEGIPVLGTVVSGVAVLWDLGSGAQSIYNCYHGVTE